MHFLHTNNTYINNDIKSNRVKDILTPVCVRREENLASNSLVGNTLKNHNLTTLLIVKCAFFLGKWSYYVTFFLGKR